jgi:tetratricopeptide (TPR) repeat protein
MRAIARTRARAVFVALAMACAVSWGTACARRSGGNADAPVVDERLMAWLSRARALHHEADLLEERGDLAGATKALERALESTPSSAIEGAEVVADTRARLAELRGRMGDVERALRDVDEGLRLVPGPSYYRGHLLEVRGTLFEQRAKSATASGDDAAAKAAKESAMASYEEAVAVQEKVIASGTSDGGAR